MIDLDEMAQGYIDAALWADCMPLTSDPDHPDYDEGYESGGLTDLDVSSEDRARVRNLCAQFVTENPDDSLAFVTQMGDWNGPADSLGHGHYSAARRFGQDLRMTGGGHGVGFLDRAHEGLDLDVAQRLSDACGFRTRFDTSGSGDVWQVDEDTAMFDRLPTDA